MNTAKKRRWVLWQRRKGSKGKWLLRSGRYGSKEAAEDAVANLDRSFDWRALPEGKVPQDNKSPSLATVEA